jgi:hypothetical protein
MCQKWRQAGGQPLKGWKVIQDFHQRLADEQRSDVLKQKHVCWFVPQVLLYENRAAPMQPPLSVMTTVLTAGGATILRYAYPMENQPSNAQRWREIKIVAPK